MKVDLQGKAVFVSDERVPGGILAGALCTTTLMMMSTDSNVSRVRELLKRSVPPMKGGRRPSGTGAFALMSGDARAGNDFPPGPDKDGRAPDGRLAPRSGGHPIG